MQAVYWVRPHESGGLQLTRRGAALVRGLGVEGIRPPSRIALSFCAMTTLLERGARPHLGPG